MKNSDRRWVLKKVKFDTYAGYGDSDQSFYMVYIDHINHRLEWESLGGAAPSWKSLINFFMSDKDIKEELIWALHSYVREKPILYRFREGMSGCEDISLWVSEARHEWAEGRNQRKVLSIHVSCIDKLNEGIPDMFSGDLLDLLNNYLGEGELLRRLTKESRRRFVYLRPVYTDAKEVRSICGSQY